MKHKTITLILANLMCDFQVSVRIRDDAKHSVMSVDDLLSRFKKEVEEFC